MHEFHWHDGLLPHWHIAGMWLWPIIIVSLGVVIYVVFKQNSKNKNKL